MPVLQEATAKQQSMLDDEASSSGEEDDDEDEEDDEEDESDDDDDDDPASKLKGIAHLKQALTAQPLNGNADSDEDDDDEDMEVGVAFTFQNRLLSPQLISYTACATYCSTSPSSSQINCVQDDDEEDDEEEDGILGLGDDESSEEEDDSEDEAVLAQALKVYMHTILNAAACGSGQTQSCASLVTLPLLNAIPRLEMHVSHS